MPHWHALRLEINYAGIKSYFSAKSWPWHNKLMFFEKIKENPEPAEGLKQLKYNDSL
jgi:hypothetical protein